MASVYARDDKWYLRYKDASGRWKAKASTSATKAEAKRLAFELERKAERQRLGLEPLPTDFTTTLAELCEWWLVERCPEKSKYPERSRLTTHVMSTPLGALELPRVTTVRIDEHLRSMQRAGLGAGSLNRLRAILHCVFNAATKAGKWTGPNPVAASERRSVPKKAYSTLRADEVPVFLAHVPERHRALFATAIWTGMRKGELIGLRKSDVDLEHGVILVARSYDKETTKGGHADAIPIAEPLRPFLEDAIARSPSELVFPRKSGAMGKAWEPFEIVLRGSLNRAGLVLGYDHTCRRCKKRGTTHVERHLEPVQRHCPKCRMALWPVPVPRKMRFHDLRHTTATLLLRAGVDVHRVQKILRHKDVRTTTMIYGHLDVEDLRSAVNQLMPGWEAPVFEQRPVVEVDAQSGSGGLVTTLLQEGSGGHEKAGTPDEKPVEIPASVLARPRGFEPLAFGFVVRRSIQLS